MTKGETKCNCGAHGRSANDDPSDAELLEQDNDIVGELVPIKRSRVYGASAAAEVGANDPILVS
jgi:hypothetical protein